MLTYLFFCFSYQNLYAQPPNDECANAIDISAAFMGNCGDVSFNGPFDLTGSTPGVDDPPEPGEQGVCPNAGDPLCFSGEPSCPTVILNDFNIPILPNISQTGEIITLAIDVNMPDDFTFNESAFQLDYALAFDGIPASQVEQQDDWYKFDDNYALIFDPLCSNTDFIPFSPNGGANGQIFLNFTIPSCPNPCEPCEISINIDSFF